MIFTNCSLYHRPRESRPAAHLLLALLIRSAFGGPPAQLLRPSDALIHILHRPRVTSPGISPSSAVIGPPHPARRRPTTARQFATRPPCVVDARHMQNNMRSPSSSRRARVCHVHDLAVTSCPCDTAALLPSSTAYSQYYSRWGNPYASSSFGVPPRTNARVPPHSRRFTNTTSHTYPRCKTPLSDSCIERTNCPPRHPRRPN
ncbi:hypothetical protein C8Q73DRAFT_144924 [Cubamyces lactineus]|nr:hypothetical protein C8Q73DRAFT_144924 [Cubamyces lactineus]